LYINLNESEINSEYSRIELWRYAFSLIQNNLFFGIGMGNFVWPFGGFLEGIREPHNGLLQILLESGIFGLISFFIIHYYIFRGKSLNSTLIGNFKRMLFIYLFFSFVSILWVSGDGHLYWFIFWMIAALQSKVSLLNKAIKIY
jgi:O-antigen ligase